MTNVYRRLCALRSYKYVFSTNIVRILQSEEMNKFTLFLVFLCGAIFAGLVSLMHSSWRFYASSEVAITSSLGAIPAGSDLELMDDGYVAMALLGAHDEDQAVSKKQTTELEDRRKYWVVWGVSRQVVMSSPTGRGREFVKVSSGEGI